MSSILRQMALVQSVFLLFFLLSAWVLVQQGRSDTAREVDSGRVVAEWLVDLSEQGVYELESLLSAPIRHLHREIIDEGALAGFPSNQEVPAWFERVMLKQHEDAEGFKLALGDGRYLVLTPDPSDEVEEVWESLLLLFWVTVLAALIASAALYWGRLQGVRPLQQLVNWIETGDVKKVKVAATQLPSFPEAQRLVGHFHQMSNDLQLEQADNQRLTQELMVLQEKERAYLARELHDDLGQYLTGIKAQAYLITQIAGCSEKIEKTAQQIIQDCEAMQQGFLRLVRSLHPVLLESLGLPQALRGLVQQWQRTSRIECALQLPESWPALEVETATHLYRLVQEALNNIARHAKATHVEIEINIVNNTLEIKVKDNGQGMQQDVRYGVGLRSMHERARCLKAQLRLLTVKGKGLSIELQVPLAENLSGVSG
ncbi:sensor histidine kinase [Nitrincola tapanii]|uniref:Sensor histidine kinase n=1 Tax=Nitrincola tapanii TaxID=1708751 RepID=A0A5A9W5B8_9GAMM|nr:sensor histidine kinase [Nitrincola tapanii]KAA0875365.1 sensor histidine kinase [Nitrincola tapanii]